MYNGSSYNGEPYNSQEPSFAPATNYPVEELTAWTPLAGPALTPWTPKSD